jgi:hypothetical protein
MGLLLRIMVVTALCGSCWAGEREDVLNFARSFLGVKEATGKNDGPEVEAFLESVGLSKGDPWCASFLYYVFSKSSTAVVPRSGWSPSWVSGGKRPVAGVVPVAGVFGIWFESLRRVAHVGLIEKNEGQWVFTIEGNTSPEGSRDGNGCYRRRRLVKQIYKVKDYLHE